MNYTSIEQSKKLIELGLSRDTADMCYYYNFKTETNSDTPAVVIGNLHDTTLRNIPIWSVGALLELIPMAERGSMELYKDWEYKYTLQNDYYCTPRFNTPIEAAYNMVVWLLENNYIKKEGNT